MFECFKCKRIVNQKITNNVYKVPIVTCSCKSKNYHFLRDHPENRCTDKQEIKLLELYCLENSKSLDVILYGSFILEIGLGDVIEVIGEVKCELVEEDIYQLKVVCNNLNIKKNTLLQYSDNEVITNVIKKNPLFNVKENIMGILISNIFSSIVGHEHVKVGLLLSLFGGTQKYVGFSDTRSEIHVLIVGDPGLGKSRMLLSCLGIIPKTFYISGGSISSSGLTISVNHDQATGEYITEAGALILSDNGICCLDELGKITEQSTLFEAMEDQIVTITKTGIVCTIPAKCTIIAAVNPKHGRFNKNKTLNENLNIDTFLLSRFDLIYILKDEMSGKENYEMYNQIIDRCKYTDSKLISFVKRRNEFYEESDLKYTLSDIRQYIDYARSTVYPILSSIAKNKIKEFYQSIKLDQKNTVNISVLETLMRLTESIAKLELKTVASEEHAIVAIKLYKKIYLFKDNEGKNFKKFKIDDLLKDYVNITESDLINKDKLVELIEKTNVKKSPNELIEILNYRGILIKKGKDEYKINFV
ncbi:MCM8 [Hepatospora eriocheir]|uniref:MCM8 n=1 Tax=Hepatospora eriocheir TaxID=1081669 RepID=A0A1X0QD24_9MICR|nr:MCM8 [Hepatospora eriocheir]